jgi:hypothetical protein
MRRSLLDALLAEYPAIVEQYSDFVEPDQLPPVNSIEDFRAIIGLTTVHLHAVERLGLPYVGFELGCSWDDEHGLGVLMHGTRVVEIGGADTAFVAWVAEQDAAKRAD